VKGKKYDSGKPALELLSPAYWSYVESSYSQNMASWYFYRGSFPIFNGYDPVPILEFGRDKYNAHNWHQGMTWGRLVGAYHRHNNYFNEREGLWLPRDLSELDEESGLEHGRHASCCWLFLREYCEAWDRGHTVGENDCSWNYGNND
jgi:hypothetical protein